MSEAAERLAIALAPNTTNLEAQLNAHRLQEAMDLAGVGDLAAERKATVERLRAAGVLMVSRAEGDAKESYLIPLAILDAEAAR